MNTMITAMTDEELIARLRMIHEWKIGKEAAERIEALTEQLTAAQHDAEEAEAYAEELEQRLAKAQGALHQIAGKKGYAYDPWGIARATLAEIKGP